MDNILLSLNVITTDPDVRCRHIIAVYPLRKADTSSYLSLLACLALLTPHASPVHLAIFVPRLNIKGSNLVLSARSLFVYQYSAPSSKQ